MNVSQIIMQQLGGNRFLAMTGAKEIVGGPNYVQFTIPRSRRINKVKIVLNGSDTYDMSFMRYIPRELRFETLSEAKGIYADSLSSAFTNATGLETRL